MKNIAVIGVGQIGSRHIQALTSCSLPFTLEVIDPDLESIENIKKRLCQEKNNAREYSVKYFPSTDGLSKEIDLCIISTSANARLSVLKKTVTTARVKYLVFEKVLFQSVDDYYEARDIIDKNNIHAWVNCPRRMYPIYREIKKIISNDTKLSYNLTGGDWGLGCNAIHFVDLLAYLTESKIRSVDISGIDKMLKQSKRPGFIEYTGTLRVTFENGSDIKMESVSGSTEPISQTIDTTEYHITVIEGEGLANMKNKKTGEIRDISFNVPYQSNLTNLVADDILLTGNCRLTSYDESMNLHIHLIKSLLDLYNQLSKTNIHVLPVT